MKKQIVELKNNSHTRKIRERAHCILMSANGKCVNQISEVLDYSRQTICKWINNFKLRGTDSFADNHRSGRPRKLNDENQLLAASLILEEPRSLKSVLSILSKETGVKISLKTIKRLLKEYGLSWKRIKKRLKSRRNEKAFRSAKKEIEMLIDQAKKEKINLFFYDESGVSLIPSVPYAWQFKGKENDLELPSFRGKNLNIAGFLGHDHSFFSYVFEESINSNAVIGCIDEFSEQISKKTYLILDNAPTHQSDDFHEKIDEWQKKGLIIKFLPTYSPELNKIEILWRFIKYKWIKLDSYQCFNKLKENLLYILKNVGSKYKINFSFLK